MRDTPQADTKPRRALKRRAATAGAAAVAFSVVLFLAIVTVAMLAGPGLGHSPAASGAVSPGNGRIAAATPTGTSASATPMPTDTASPTATAWAGLPAGTAPAERPAAGSTCEPDANVACPTLPVPTPLPSVAVAAGPAATLHVPIFEYHRIKPFAGETGYAQDLIVPPDLFAAQMDAMAAAGWHTITMGKLGDDLRRGIQPAARTFVVTFDDGYEDGFTFAFPILQRDGFVATYFVIGGRIGDTEQLTVSELGVLLAAGNEIGNHTMSHRDLRVLTPDQLRSEIYGTSEVIAHDVGVWPQSFCYPIGLTDPEVSAAVAATPGIETAVIQTGSKTQTWSNRLELPRIRVGPASYPQDVVARATGYAQ